MKKILTLMLCLVLVLSLCACGGNTQEQTPDAPAGNDTPVPETPEAPADSGEAEDPSEEEPSAEDPSEDPVAIARGYIDKPLSELIAVIGEPESSDYASSCMGDGEDGMLFYDGFIVYTYREGDSEVVYDVE